MSNNDLETYEGRRVERERICRAVQDGLQSGILEPRHIEEVFQKARGENSFPFRFKQRANFDYFIQEERKNYPGESNNYFSLAFGQVARYEDFLTRILKRYTSVCADFKASVQVVTGPKVLSRWEEDERRYHANRAWFEIALQAQIEVESFYVFAKMFLDHIARSLEHHFGPVRNSSLDSHDDLVRCLTLYSSSLSLELPSGFYELAADLKLRVSDYRDYQIAHNKMSRPVHATTTGGGDSLLLQIFTWNPNATEPPKASLSEPLLSLMESLDLYLSTALELVETNREKAKIWRKAHQGK